MQPIFCYHHEQKKDSSLHFTFYTGCHHKNVLLLATKVIVIIRHFLIVFLFQHESAWIFIPTWIWLLGIMGNENKMNKTSMENITHTHVHTILTCYHFLFLMSTDHMNKNTGIVLLGFCVPVCVCISSSVSIFYPCWHVLNGLTGIGKPERCIKLQPDLV